MTVTTPTLCAICGKPITGRAVPFHVKDERFPSGRVFKVRKAHPECLPGREPPPAPKLAA